MGMLKTLISIYHIKIIERMDLLILDTVLIEYTWHAFYKFKDKSA